MGCKDKGMTMQSSVSGGNTITKRDNNNNTMTRCILGILLQDDEETIMEHLRFANYKEKEKKHKSYYNMHEQTDWILDSESWLMDCFPPFARFSVT